MSPSPISISHRDWIPPEAVAAFGRHDSTRVQLSRDPDFLGFLAEGRAFLLEELASDGDVYGATTGFGSSSHQRLSPEHGLKLQENLVRYHGCGVGPALREDQCAAALLVRANCLARGASAVSIELLDQIERFLAARLFPVIPAMGSVGASGDLTPLSYIAAALMGEREVYENGKRCPTREAMARHGITPYSLKEREGLALMNGTSVMTGIAALALADARALADLASDLTGLMVELLGGRSTPFMPELNRLKPHPGQAAAASRILALMHRPDDRRQRPLGATSRPLQDCYSVRCAPQVIGVLYDALTWADELVGREINSVNDNPVILPEQRMILNGGLFFGGHVAIACDTVKAATISVVNLMDRQLALLMEPARNGVLPENLVATTMVSDAPALHHGFKAMQITASALAAEALKNAQPAAVLSRPTEASNQDVVSMGTIAARDLDHVIGLAHTVAGIHGLALRQGFFVLEAQGGARSLTNEARTLIERIGVESEPVVDDRPLEGDIHRTVTALFLRPSTWS